MEPAEKSVPGPAARRRWALALAGLLWVGLIAAGCYYRFATKPEQGPPKESPKDCQVHHVKMAWTRVPVYYGNVDNLDEYMEAVHQFPNLMVNCVFIPPRSALPGWVVSLKEKCIRLVRGNKIERHYGWIPVCPKCTEAGKLWRDAYIKKTSALLILTRPMPVPKDNKDGKDD